MQTPEFVKLLALVLLSLAMAPAHAQSFDHPGGMKPTLLVMDGAGIDDLILKIECGDAVVPPPPPPPPPDDDFSTGFDFLQSTDEDAGDCDDVVDNSPGLPRRPPTAS